jgi:hypothetical protein
LRCRRIGRNFAAQPPSDDEIAPPIEDTSLLAQLADSIDRQAARTQESC